METFRALKRLNDILEKTPTSTRQEPVIDITGEEEIGGTSSKNLTDHMNSKHCVGGLPCELCKFVGKTTEEYKKHVENTHAKPKETFSKDGSKKDLAQH